MYKLVFTQRFKLAEESKFMKLEKMFMQFEMDNPMAPKGKRFVPYIGAKTLNTLIWECEFETLEEAFKAKKFLEDDDTHTGLFEEQSRYFENAFVEIYKMID